MNTLAPTSDLPTQLHVATVGNDGMERDSTASPSRVERPPVTNIWGIPFSRLDMDQTVELAAKIIENRRPEYFVTANLNYVMLTHQTPRLTEVNQQAAAVLADGFPVVLRSRLTRDPLPGRVTGADLIFRLAELAQQRSLRIYFLGGAPGVAPAAAQRLQSMYPGMQIAGHCAPPFRAMSSAEHAAMISAIQQAAPDILLVAFGQPKGELWIYDHLNELKVPLSIQIGASLDFITGTSRRAPAAFQRWNCEWLYRALSEPRRLGPRYAGNALHLARLLVSDACLSLASGLRRRARQEPPARSK